MPRRHQRVTETAPLDLTPADIPKPEKSWREIKAERQERDARTRERTRLRRIRRVTDAIDWDSGTCCIPGCDQTAHISGASARDPLHALPICFEHEAVVWRYVQNRKFQPTYINVINELEARDAIDQEALHEAEKKLWLEKNTGSIYYLRLNGLIKVGWSRDLEARLKAYGPDVELLCHYRATRQDETTLHRQLRPFLARGREWYQDCQLLADMVAKAVEDHGPPTASAAWSVPKKPAVGRRPSARPKPTGLSIA